MTNIEVEILQQTIDIEVQEQVIELEVPQATIITNNQWGSLVGNLSDQTDLQDALDEKLDVTALSSNITLYATTTASDIGGYNKLVTSLSDIDYDEPAVNVSTGAISGDDQLVGQLVSIAGLFIGNPGIINITTIGEIRKTGGSGSSSAQFYFKVFHRTSSGTETEIAVSNPTMPITNTDYAQFSTSAILNNGAFTSTDRIVIKFYASKVGGTNPTYDFNFGGENPVRTLLPIPAELVLTNYYTKEEIDELPSIANNVDGLVLNYVNETYITDDNPRSATTFLYTLINGGVNSRTNIELGISGIIPDEYYTTVTKPDDTLLISTYPGESLIDISSIPNTVSNINLQFIAGNTGYKLSYIKIRYVDTNSNPQELFTNFITSTGSFGMFLAGSYIVNNKQGISVVHKGDDYYYINSLNELVQETNASTILQYNNYIFDNDFVTSSHALSQDYDVKLKKDYLKFNLSEISSTISGHQVTQVHGYGTTFNIKANTTSSQIFNIYVDDNMQDGMFFYVRTGTVTNTKVKTLPGIGATITIEGSSEYTMLQNMSYHFMYDKKENDIKLVSKSSI